MKTEEEEHRESMEFDVPDRVWDKQRHVIWLVRGLTLVGEGSSIGHERNNKPEITTTTQHRLSATLNDLYTLSIRQ